MILFAFERIEILAEKQTNAGHQYFPIFEKLINSILMFLFQHYFTI